MDGDQRTWERKMMPLSDPVLAKFIGTQFKDRSWADMLESEGCVFLRFEGADEDYYRHEGAAGDQATLVANYQGSGLLHVATGDLPPLKAGEQYTKFEFYAAMRFDGDTLAAAASLGFKAPAAKKASKALAEEGRTNGHSNGHIEEDLSAEIDPREKVKFEPSDLGNAERFVRAYGRNLRYCHKWQNWLMWRGWGWEEDENGGAHQIQMAVEMVRDMAKEALLPECSSEMSPMLVWAAKSQSKERLESTTSLAKKLRGIPVHPSQLDRNANFLNLRNGTLDLRTLTLSPHREEDLITKLIDVPFEPEADCPFWKSFLARVLDHDEDLIRYIQKAAGYTLTGDTSEKCFFFLHGSGNNGKSIFIETLTRVLGPYAKQLDVESLMLQKNNPQGPSNDLAALKGARMVVSSETEDGRQLSESKIKRLTGGDTITCRFLNKEFFSYMPEFKIWIAGNHRPEIKGTDEGIWSRVHLIPFEVCIPKEQRIPAAEMHRRLKEESAGILTWTIEGYNLWKKEGLKAPKAVSAAVEDYRSDSDVFGAFLSDCTEIDEYSEGVRSIDMYNAYVKWAKQQGDREPKSMQKFGRVMADRGEPSKKTETGRFFTQRVLKSEPVQQAMHWQDRD
jgi:putative DNA primase/helicase